MFGDNGEEMALRGAGTDDFRSSLGDDRDTVEGQDGRNALLFFVSNDSENIDISANGERARFFRNASSIKMLCICLLKAPTFERLRLR